MSLVKDLVTWHSWLPEKIKNESKRIKKSKKIKKKSKKIKKNKNHILRVVVGKQKYIVEKNKNDLP